MNTSHKPKQLQSLLGVLLSLVAVTLVIWKSNSTCPGKSMTTNSRSAPRAMRTRSLHPASMELGRGNDSSSIATPLDSTDLSQAASLAAQDFSPYLPTASSEAAITFQVGRAKLMRDHQQLMRRLAHASAEEQHQAMEKWQEQHADELAAQQHLAIQMGAESRPPKLHVPATPSIPDNATPELREFLTARHAVMKEQAEMMNQLQNATSEERHQAMEKWHEQNATHLEVMQTTAAQLAESQNPLHLPHR